MDFTAKLSSREWPRIWGAGQGRFYLYCVNIFYKNTLVHICVMKNNSGNVVMHP